MTIYDNWAVQDITTDWDDLPEGTVLQWWEESMPTDWIVSLIEYDEDSEVIEAEYLSVPDGITILGVGETTDHDSTIWPVLDFGSVNLYQGWRILIPPLEYKAEQQPDDDEDI